MSKPQQLHWDSTHHGHFKIDPNEGSVVDFDTATPGGKFTVVQGPPVAPPAADAVVAFEEFSGGRPIVDIQPINGATIAGYDGSFHQAITSGVNPTTLSYQTGGFSFFPTDTPFTLIIHTNDGHYLAIGDIVQTTGHGHNAAADLHFSFDYAFFA